MKILDDSAPYEEFEQFLSEHMHDGKLSFDGLFCVTDRLAYLVLDTLHKLNQRVPEDVQLIGFDGIRSFGNIDYHCSTIVQPVPEMAEMCVELLLPGKYAHKTAACLSSRQLCVWGNYT